MAEITVESLLQLLNQDADIRREGMQSEANIRRDVAFEGGYTRRDVASEGGSTRRDVQHESSRGIDSTKTSSWAVSDRVGTEADRVVAQDTAYFIAAQSQNFSNATALAALKASQDASFSKTQADIALAAQTASSAAALEGAKNAAATALAAANTQATVTADGNTTRALINELRNQDTNRLLIERNNELHHAHHDNHCCNAQLSNAQNNQVLSAINAFQSQLTETRQGMVNLGTMVGVGQTSTPTNIR